MEPESPACPALAGGFFKASATWEAQDSLKEPYLKVETSWRVHPKAFLHVPPDQVQTVLLFLCF